MRNIPIEFEITNDQLASMETTDIESFLYETIRENISTQLLTQLEDDGFIDISPTDTSYRVTCNLVLGSQKEFYSAITDVAKELIARHYNESVTNHILSSLYKLMGEEPKVNDAEEDKQSVLEKESTCYVGVDMAQSHDNALADAVNYGFASYVPNFEQMQIHTTPSQSRLALDAIQQLEKAARQRVELANWLTAEDIRDAARRASAGGSMAQSELAEWNEYVNEQLDIQRRRQNEENQTEGTTND